MKQGILIVSFGTTFRETREKNIDQITETVRVLYPDALVKEAFSSRIVRKILEERDGIRVPDTKMALEEMKREGVTDVTVLPTHIIDGIENNRMKQMVRESRKLFARIKIAGALLEKEEDYERMARVYWNCIEQEAGEDPVILMGHGSAHQADESYQKMELALRSYSGKKIYIATVEGAITIEDVIARMNPEVAQKGRILLTPFMLVAGDHANHDMAGEQDSFASRLREEGYQPQCLLKGLGEYEGIREIYISHLQEAG